MEQYFRSIFEKLNYAPKEFAVKYKQKHVRSEIDNTCSFTFTLNAAFLSDIEPNQFHANDYFTGEIVEVGGITNYENRKYVRRYFVKGDGGKSWLTKDDIYLFHKPFGNHKECHSARYDFIRPNQYLIEYFPLAEVVHKIRKIYLDEIDKSLPYQLDESFQFESFTFKYCVEFVPRTI